MKLKFISWVFDQTVATGFALSALAALVMTNASAAAAATDAAINMNNAGVDELEREKYELAIRCFEGALVSDPSYSLARRNLAIAENNYGLSLRRQPIVAIKHMHRALLLDGTNVTTRQNLEGLLRIIKKNPESYEDRIALAESAGKIGEHLDAAVEYSEALKLHENSEVRHKFNAELKLVDKYFYWHHMRRKEYAPKTRQAPHTSSPAPLKELKLNHVG